MEKNDLENLKSSMYLLCEACGAYHSEDDCEIVIVKIIKGKNCNLNMTKDNTVFTTAKTQTTTPTIMPSGITQQPVMPTVQYQHPANAPQPENAPTDGVIIPPGQQKKIMSVIPPGIAGTMIPPGHPSFDRLGAKESRRV